MSAVDIQEGATTTIVVPDVSDGDLEAQSTLTDLAFGELVCVAELGDMDEPDSVADGFEEPEQTDASALVFHAMAAEKSLFREAHIECAKSCFKESARLFFSVYKAVPLKSDEAQSPAAKAAINKEIKNMEQNSVFAGYDTATELSTLRSIDPDALVVFAHLLLGLKGVEIGDPIWKARLVAGGNQLLDRFGVHFHESDLHGAPTSLEVVRIVVWWSTMSPLHSLLQADVCHAYLQARLRGPAVHVVLPKIVWPSVWFHNDGSPIYKFPCLRLHRAMYGLRRAGFDWLAHAERILESQGWLAIRDYCDSLYMKSTSSGMLLLALYVDDLLASGPTDELMKALDKLRGV